MSKPLLVLLSVLGIIDAGYIAYTHARKLTLACMSGHGTCDIVINSKYNKTLGVSNEWLGIVYYSAVVITVLFFPVFLEHWIMLLIAAGAAGMSIFLTVIQAFVLRNWCEYCLLSAGLNIGILLVIIFA